MAGIVADLKVLDLSTGIAGPMVGMLLADNGADVVRVERPGGDRLNAWHAYRVWQRGKHSTVLDLKQESDHGAFLKLVGEADVLIESFRPGATRRLRIDAPSLLESSPQLIYCSITGYGRHTPYAQRPSIDALVAARAGLQWDQRGYFGNRYDHLAGLDLRESDVLYDPGVEQTGNREGPIFSAVPWPSLGAAMLAFAGISAALWTRQTTGRGQWLETSLLQGVMMDKVAGWQRAEHPDYPGYRLWYFDRRGNKGIFQAGDGRWLHQWAPIEHSLTRALAAGREDAASCIGQRLADESLPDDPLRYEIAAYPETAAAFHALPRSEWVRKYAELGAPAQPIRSPEEALLDETLASHRGITSVQDAELGELRQVGVVIEYEKSPAPPIVRGAPAPGSSGVAQVLGRWHGHRHGRHAEFRDAPDHPLQGLLVLDFGLAIAGPFGPQLLADLGATVIKVSQQSEVLSQAIHQAASRGKQSLAIDLKIPQGLRIVHQLMAKADVVHHNMRTGVAERLQIDYATAKRLNPKIVYCHTRGFEPDGPRMPLPGNDQMGNALAGTEYEMGGVAAGGKPIWPTNAFGDLGTGALSAAAVLLALRHREMTGEGQFVGGSILNTCMLYNSYTYVNANGEPPARLRIDALQYGFSALYRLYETADGWLCICADGDRQWRGLCDALSLGPAAEGFRESAARLRRDQELGELLAGVLKTRDAADWYQRLDAEGVPCEIASSSFAKEALSDPLLRQLGWTDSYLHPHLGRVEQPGNLIDFSLTPGCGRGPAPITGQHTVPILRDLGYSDSEIESLIAHGVVAAADTSHGG